MPFPQQLDFDRLAVQTYDRITEAIDGWLSGEGFETEEAFLNRITGLIKKPKRNCDVGNIGEYKMRADIARLHRMGENNTDEFGADLAITIFVESGKASEPELIKTVFFQTKLSTNYDVQLERKQIRQASQQQDILERSFVFVLDKVRAGMRIAPVANLELQFQEDSKTRDLNCRNWMTFGEWLLKWFSCEVGKDSDRNNPSIEKMLERYFRSPTWNQGVPWDSFKSSVRDIEGDFLPAKRWWRLFFAPTGSDWL